MPPLRNPSKVTAWLTSAIKHYLRAASIFEENGERKIAAELEELVKGLRERKSGYRKVLKSMHNR